MVNKPLSRKSNVVVQEFANEVLIYDLKINKVFCLNQTSAMVYQLSDGINSVAEISNLMSAKFKELISEDFVWLALDELKRENLLENGDESNDHFAGSARREVIKKIGLASLVAFPLILSIAAPNAAMAQSVNNLAINVACTSSSQCQSGNCIPIIGGGNSCCSPGSTVPARGPGPAVGQAFYIDSAHEGTGVCAAYVVACCDRTNWVYHDFFPAASWCSCV